MQGSDGGAERPLGSSGSAPSTDRRRLPSSVVAGAAAAVPERRPAAAADHRLPLLETQTGYESSTRVVERP